MSIGTHIFLFASDCRMALPSTAWHLTSIPSCLFSLTCPTQSWGTWSDCRIDYLKGKLGSEYLWLSNSFLTLNHSVFQDLALYKADVKAHGSLSLHSASLSKIPGYLMSQSPRIPVSMHIPGPKGVEF